MSDFGKGLTYCLGLFLAHSGREIGTTSESYDAGIWFNGASDHLYDLQIPEDLLGGLQSRLKRFQRKVLGWGHGFTAETPTERDQQWAIQEAKNLLRLIDKSHGIKTQRGHWE